MKNERDMISEMNTAAEIALAEAGVPEEYWSVTQLLLLSAAAAATETTLAAVAKFGGERAQKKGEEILAKMDREIIALGKQAIDTGDIGQA